MAEIINLDERRGPLDFELPFIEPENVPVIKRLKNSVGVLVGYSYLTELVSLTKRGKNILSRDNISTDNLPYNIESHLSKMSVIEKETLSREISQIMKVLKDGSKKEQLFYLRSKILSSIKIN